VNVDPDPPTAYEFDRHLATGRRCGSNHIVEKPAYITKCLKNEVFGKLPAPSPRLGRAGEVTDNETLQALRRITSRLPVIRPQSAAGGFCLSRALSERLWRFGINRIERPATYLPGWPTNLSFACNDADRAHKPGRWRLQFCSFPAQE